MFETILNDLADSAVPKYSPGPWCPYARGHRIKVRDARGRLVADVASAADADLIANGPELVLAARSLIAAIARRQDNISDELADLNDLCYIASGGTPGPDGEGGDGPSNAVLMAAAPALLAAVRRLLDVRPGYSDITKADEAALLAAEAAVAQAEGRS